jgi:hypothetical protein
MDRLTESIVTIAVAIIGLATLAVIVSRNANTVGVIKAGGGVFNNSLATAISPVTGNQAAAGGGYNSGFGSFMGGLPDFSNFGG